MKNVVTPETARKLKEAGFPQPVKVECGEIWYSANDKAFVIICHSARSAVIGWTGLTSSITGTLQLTALQSCTFAPTATDILSDLGNDYHIGMLDGVFVSGLHQFGQSDLQFNYNPAEAAASAWLEKYAK